MRKLEVDAKPDVRCPKALRFLLSLQRIRFVTSDQFHLGKARLKLASDDMVASRQVRDLPPQSDQ